MSPYTPRRQIIAKIKQREIKLQKRQESLSRLQELSQSIFERFNKYKNNITKLYFKIKLPLFNLKQIEKSKILTEDLAQLKPQRVKTKKQNTELDRIVKSPTINFKLKISRLIPSLKPLTALIVLSLPIISKRFIKQFSWAFSITWKYRYQFGLTLLTLAIINNAASLNMRYQKLTQLNNWQINLWPTLPSTQLEKANESFFSGNREMTMTFFKSAETSYLFLQKIGLGLVFNNSYQQTKALILKPQQREWQIGKIAELEQKYPYSWQLLATKAWYHRELYQDDSATKTIEMVKWLYPDSGLTVSSN